MLEQTLAPVGATLERLADDTHAITTHNDYPLASSAVSVVQTVRAMGGHILAIVPYYDGAVIVVDGAPQMMP
jgi:hypothetical protein